MRVLKRENRLYSDLEEIFRLMDRLGVEFNIINATAVEVSKNGATYSLVDSEDARQPVSELAPRFEYKLVKE